MVLESDDLVMTSEYKKISSSSSKVRYVKRIILHQTKQSKKSLSTRRGSHFQIPEFPSSLDTSKDAVRITSVLTGFHTKEFSWREPELATAFGCNSESKSSFGPKK